MDSVSLEMRPSTKANAFGNFFSARVLSQRDARSSEVVEPGAVENRSVVFGQGAPQALSVVAKLPSTLVGRLERKNWERSPKAPHDVAKFRELKERYVEEIARSLGV
jgi:hypothetical protein